MSILARYKKRGGFRQLLELIETSTPEKQSKLLKVIEQEDAEMASQVQAKTLTSEKVLNWKPETLFQILRKMPQQYATIVCKQMPEELYHNVIEHYDLRARKEFEHEMANTKDPLPSEIIAAFGNMFKIIRQLDEDREIILSQIDPSLRIPEAA